jgi:streptogramin lyase
MGCRKEGTPNFPSITSFTPSSGNSNDQVIIIGTNFSSTISQNVVSFNGTPATIMNATATQLTVTVPVAATTGKIYVTVKGLTAESSSDFIKITTPNPPVIVSFTPRGSVGDEIKIIGTNFHNTSSNNIVKFNGIVATVISSTTTELTVVVPIGATTGKITLTINGQTATTVSDFTKLGIVSTFAGTGARGFVDGLAAASQFDYPVGITIDASGNLFVADKQNSSIRKITSSGVVSTIATFDISSSPAGLAVDASGNIYVADSYYNSIRKITATGSVTTFAGGIPQGGFADGIGASARFNKPRDVAVDLQGNVFVADADNSSIRKITPAGVVTTLINGATSELISPVGITIDKFGNLYVVDFGFIRKISVAGTLTTIAGGNTGFLDGMGSGAMFSYPKGIAVDTFSNLYIADGNNNKIRKINPTGLVITIAGAGDYGFLDGPASKAQFSSAVGVAVDAAGNVFIADNHNNRIRKLIQ